MKNLEYENKMVKDIGENKLKTTKTTTKTRKKNYIVIAPNGNQYSVPPQKLEQFKETMSVNDSWKIK